MSLIGHPFPLVHIPPIGIQHFPHTLTHAIDPKPGVDASVRIDTLPKAMSFVIVKASVVMTSIGIGECAVTMTLAGGISLANVVGGGGG